MWIISFEAPAAAPGSDAGAAAAPRPADNPGAAAFDEHLRRAHGEEEHPSGAAAAPSEPPRHRGGASPATASTAESSGKGGGEDPGRDEKDGDQEAIAPVAAQASTENTGGSSIQPDRLSLQVTAGGKQASSGTKAEEPAGLTPAPKGATRGAISVALEPNSSRLHVAASGQTIVSPALAVPAQESAAASDQPVEVAEEALKQRAGLSDFPASAEKKLKQPPADGSGPSDTPTAAASGGQNLAPAAISALVPADGAMATAAPTSEGTALAQGMPAQRTSRRGAHGVGKNAGAAQPSQREVFARERDEAATAEAAVKANRPLLAAEPRLNHDSQGMVRPSEPVPLHPAHSPEAATGRPGASDTPSPPQAAPEHMAGSGSGMEPAERVRFVQRVARAMEAADIRGTPLRIRLHPPELGSLRVEVTVRNGGLSARLEAETEAARTLLLDHLPMLRERLGEHHLRIERFDVQWSGGSSGGWSQRPGQESPGQAYAQGVLPEPRHSAAAQAAASPPASPRRRAHSHIDIMI